MVTHQNGPALRKQPGPRPKGYALSTKQSISRPTWKLSSEDKAEIIRLYTTPLPDGTWMGTTTIAKRFGVTHPCVQYHLKRAGVKMRSAAEAHSGGKRCKPIKNLPVGDAPLCKCGCESVTEWNQRKNRWNRYVAGHYTQRGEQNHAHIDGRSHLPYAEDWPAISLATRRRDGFKCQRCFGPSRNLHVHHIDCDKQNNGPENLITLCAPCHGTVHAEMRKGVI